RRRTPRTCNRRSSATSFSSSPGSYSNYYSPSAKFVTLVTYRRQARIFQAHQISHRNRRRHRDWEKERKREREKERKRDGGIESHHRRWNRWFTGLDSDRLLTPAPPAPALCHPGY